MCTTLTHDVDATIRQIELLQEAGCEIARVAVPDKRGGEALKEIVRRSILPVVADIHFDYRLALMALDAKVHKLRLNPGNIHNKDGVREVVKRAKEQGTPIRIGVNHGSIGDRQPGDIRDEAQRMVDLALSEIRILEDLDFDNIVVSVKAFEVPVMIAAYRRLAKAVPYPLHLGVTEAGTALSGSIRSAAGMSVLLYEGIGDTIRVSLSEDPVAESPEAFARRTAHTRTQCPSGTAHLSRTTFSPASSRWGARASRTSTFGRPASTSSSLPSATSWPAIFEACASTKSSHPSS